MKSRIGIPTPLLFLPSIFISKVSKSSWQGQPREQLPQGCPRAHLHHSLAEEHTTGCFRRADPQLQSLWGSLGQTHRAMAQLLCRQINFVQVHSNQFKLQFLLRIALQQTFHRSICLLGAQAEGRNVALVFCFFKSPPSLILDTHFCMRQGKKGGQAQPAEAAMGLRHSQISKGVWGKTGTWKAPTKPDTSQATGKALSTHSQARACQDSEGHFS